MKHTSNEGVAVGTLHDIMVARAIVKAAGEAGKISRSSYVKGDMFLQRAYNLQDIAHSSVQEKEQAQGARVMTATLRERLLGMVLTVPVIIAIIVAAWNQ